MNGFFRENVIFVIGLFSLTGLVFATSHMQNTRMEEQDGTSTQPSAPATVTAGSADTSGIRIIDEPVLTPVSTKPTATTLAPTPNTSRPVVSKPKVVVPAPATIRREGRDDDQDE